MSLVGYWTDYKVDRSWYQQKFFETRLRASVISVDVENSFCETYTSIIIMLERGTGGREDWIKLLPGMYFLKKRSNEQKT